MEKTKTTSKEDMLVGVEEIRMHIKRFARYCYIKNKRELDNIKESLLEARGELEKMITLVLNYIKKEDVQLNKKVTDIIYEEFAINFSGYMKMIDEEQNAYFVKVSENDMSLSRLVAFKIFLETAYFDIVFLPLKIAMEDYKKKKDKSEFYYKWFMGVASTLKIKAGLRREGVSSRLFKGKGQYAPYSLVLNEIKKAEIGDDNIIDKEYKDTFPEEFPEDDFEKEEHGGDEDEV